MKKGLKEFDDYFSVLPFLFFLMITGIGCKKDIVSDQALHLAGQASGPSLQEANPNARLLRELVVWRKPSTTKLQFDKWLNIIKRDGDVVIKYACNSCDSSLMLLTGRGIEVLIQGPSSTGGIQSYEKAPVTGDYGPVLVSFNYPMNMNEIDTMHRVDRPARPTSVHFSKQPAIKVAVFDTGLMLDEFNGYLYTSYIESCIPGAQRGYDFADNTNVVTDNHTGQHGTTVARLIIDQVNRYKRNPIEILPVKTHNRNGLSSLYNILCAFAYAQERKVDIINASFGYYSPRLENYPGTKGVDPKTVLLKEYIKYYLTSKYIPSNKNILLIAAAGNRNEDALRDAFALYGLPVPEDFRSLDKVSFYPASLARDPDFPNVFAVTTIDTLQKSVSPFQNYSPEVVDIGVQADRVASGGKYVFFNPRSVETSNTLEGSSFATPIATGKICAFYDLYQHLYAPGTRTTSKKGIFGSLKNNKIIKEYPGLLDDTRLGQVIQK